MVFIACLFLMFFAKADIVKYKKITVSQEEIIAEGLDFEYDFLEGKIGEINIDKNQDILNCQKLNFSFKVVKGDSFTKIL